MSTFRKSPCACLLLVNLLLAAAAGAQPPSEILETPATPTLEVEGTPAPLEPEEALPSEIEERALELAAARLGAAPDALQLIERGTLRYPMLEIEGFSLKVAEIEEGESLALYLDREGNELPVEELELEEEATRQARFGNLDRSLIESLRSAGIGQPVPVMIWLDLPPYEQPERPGEGTEPTAEEIDEFLREVDARLAEFLEPFVFGMVERLAELGVEAEPAPLSPLLMAEMTPGQLAEIAHWEEIDRVYEAPTLSPHMEFANPTVGANVVHSRGRTGLGVRVAQVETGGRVDLTNPYFSGIIQDSQFVCSSPSAEGGHASKVAGVINSFHRTHRGIAPSARLHALGSCTGNSAELATVTGTALSSGAKVVNLSLGSDTGRAMEGFARFFDNLVSTRFRTIVASAGNSGWCVLFICGSGNVETPGTGYNVITVGGSYDHDTTRRTDDTMYWASSFRDPNSRNGGRTKPEVVAPAYRLKGAKTNGWVGDLAHGTSFAAPAVTGGAALLIQAQRRLASWPETIRAILLATALNDIEGNATRSEKDGAGAIMLDEADRVATRTKGNWGTMKYQCGSIPSRHTVATMRLKSAHTTRVAISWNTNPAAAGYPAMPSADLDLRIFDPSGRQVATSASFDNTWELVQFSPARAGDYRIEIRRFRCSADPPFLGWAWWQDD